MRVLERLSRFEMRDFKQVYIFFLRAKYSCRNDGGVVGLISFASFRMNG